MAANIIAISGRIGSGKDTVGKIIQLLTWEQTICDPFITNNDRVDAISNAVTSRMIDGASEWKVKKYALKLKQVASLLTGIPVEKFEDQEFKKTYLGEQWDGMTVRQLLQKLGTESIRDGLHTNAWVNALFADYTERSKWIITDLRFQNEYDAVLDKGGITIRVNRPLPEQDYATLENLHPSETALDHCRFHWYINNNGGLENLIEDVKHILKSERIIK